MITLVTGALGHGKSYRTVRLIDESVHAGIPVATNVALRDDWPLVMARRHTFLGRWRKDAVARKAARYSLLVHCTDDLEQLLRVRFRGSGEGRGRLILDEAHRWMNTRAWDQAPGLTRNQAIAQRLAVIAHLSGSRHYGEDVWLISQDEKNIDSQVRSLYEFHSECRNMRRLPIVGAILKKNVFLVVTRWNDRSQTKAGVELYGLSKSLARLYKTHALEEHDWPDDAIVLPKQPAAETGAAPQQTDGGQASAASRTDGRRRAAPNGHVNATAGLPIPTPESDDDG